MLLIATFMNQYDSTTRRRCLQSKLSFCCDRLHTGTHIECIDYGIDTVDIININVAKRSMLIRFQHLSFSQPIFALHQCLPLRRCGDVTYANALTKTSESNPAKCWEEDIIQAKDMNFHSMQMSSFILSLSRSIKCVCVAPK